MIDIKHIERAFSENGSDKHIHGYHHYYLDIFKEPPNSIMEIGIKAGGSLFAWRDLFPNATIVGMDINPEELSATRYAQILSNNINCVFADSTDPEKVATIDQKFDIIIDDGSHFYVDIMATFDNFKDKFNKYYIIEDSMYDHEGVVEFIKSKGFSNVEVYDSTWRVNVPVPSSFLKYGIFNDSTETIITTLKWIKVTK